MPRLLSLGLVAAAALTAPVAAFAAEAPGGSTTVPGTGTTTPRVTPAVPAPTRAKSPFRANRLASEPLGLGPNDVRDPFEYPAEPIVLSWTQVPGAVSYRVEVASNPGFSKVVWELDTDQHRAALDLLLPDGSYWWRVTATDAAGTVGRTSRVARFTKTWPNRIAGMLLSAAPGGAPVSHLLLNPYMRWSAVPGAKEYDVEVAPGDQFGSPAFLGQKLHAPYASPAGAGALADDIYSWRVRGRDPNDNPGPWTTSTAFRKAWVAPNVTAPADDAVTHDVNLRWDPVAGAEAYEVQISSRQHVWSGDHLQLFQRTASTGFTPSLSEQLAKDLSLGNLWWRVRPVISGRFGAWASPRHITWALPGATTGTAQLSSDPDSDTALMPRLTWTAVTGASLYRVDIATDAQFNNIVESQMTSSTSWVSRVPLPDNQITSGYHWRVVWGSGTIAEDPRWMVAEDAAPTATFRKQTRVTLGSGDLGQIGQAPLLTWGAVPGVARFEVQLSQDGQFDTAVREATIWGTGYVPGTGGKEKLLPDGTWLWRVRAVDGGGQAQTWSPVGRFTLTASRPVQEAPRDGQAAVGAPTFRWSVVPGACAYQLQISRDPAFKDVGGAADGAITTAQRAHVPTREVIPGPGVYHWRVRADLCDDVVGQWSPTRSFRSVRAPNFNLNSIPSKVTFKRRIVVSGRLVHNGRRVRRARLRLERRFWPSRGYRRGRVVRTDARGRFRFRLRMTRSASYRLLWKATAAHPEGVAPFAVTVTPRVTLVVKPRRVERRGFIRLRGSVFPRRRAVLQERTSDAGETVRRFKPRRARFGMALRANFRPGRHQLRLLVPRDKRRRLGTASSRRRGVLVFDRFVVRGR